MLYNFQRKKLCRHLLVGGVLCVAGFGILSCSDRYELDEDQPSGLDNIYGYMQKDGHFTNYLHLIDDLGQKEVLSKTGSKTMFIADDNAFKDFYASNDWGVKKYEDLSLAQKKLLLNSSMVGNPYTTTMISSAPTTGSSGGAVKGEVCRRSTSQELFDSVMVIASSDPNGILPNNSFFDEVRANRDSIVLFTDASKPAPLLHFTGKFVQTNRLSLSDIDFIYNQPEGTFHSDNIYVNNSRVTKPNLFCKNGFVHQVDKVIVPLDNMAEIIRKNPKMSLFSSIIERFAVPVDSTALRESYNVAKGTNYDSVFVKRYISELSWGSKPFYMPKQYKFDGNLKFDPGWNGYVSPSVVDREPMMEDMAVMLVPSDDALKKWWSGSIIEQYYGTIEEAPTSVLQYLVRVNQLPSFTSAVPSMFGTVQNDANELLGITKDDVESVYLGCNGLVYLTKKVFAPARYSSVLYPATIDTKRFSYTNQVVSEPAPESLNDKDKSQHYDVYLNSMVARYIFLLPTNKAFSTYLDPCTYGKKGALRMWDFQFAGNTMSDVSVNVYECEDNGDGTFKKKGSPQPLTNEDIIRDRLEDIFENMIIVEPYREGKKYYRTKGRNFVRVEKKGDKSYEVSGSYHENVGQPLVSVDAYDGEDIRNGITLVVDDIAMGTPNSVAKTLKDAVVDGNNIFSEFYKIVKECAVSKSNAKKGYDWLAGDQEDGNLFVLTPKRRVGAEDASEDKATFLLNNYHYTIYAPTNEAMEKAYEYGLPTFEDYFTAQEDDKALALEGTKDSKADAIKEVWRDFIKYHIQDNAIFVDVDTAGTFGSAKTEMTIATAVMENVPEGRIKDDVVSNAKGDEFEIVKDKDGNRMVTPQADGKYTVVYYPGTYIAGRPYGLQFKVKGGEMYVTDCRNGYDPESHKFLGGNQTKVVLKNGAYNLMAREYWFKKSNASGGDSYSNLMIDNSSFAVIHAIDEPLIFADGNHFDADGHKIEDQFHYIYKKLK